jgi:hypothetical protein
MSDGVLPGSALADTGARALEMLVALEQGATAAEERLLGLQERLQRAITEAGAEVEQLEDLAGTWADGALKLTRDLQGQGALAREGLTALGASAHELIETRGREQTRLHEAYVSWSADVTAVEESLASPTEDSEAVATSLHDQAQAEAARLGEPATEAIQALERGLSAEVESFGQDLAERVTMLATFLAGEAPAALGEATLGLLRRLEDARSLVEQALLESATDLHVSASRSVEAAGEHQEEVLQDLSQLTSSLEAQIGLASDQALDHRRTTADSSQALSRANSETRSALTATLSEIHSTEAILHRYSFVRF